MITKIHACPCMDGNKNQLEVRSWKLEQQTKPRYIGGMHALKHKKRKKKKGKERYGWYNEIRERERERELAGQRDKHYFFVYNVTISKGNLVFISFHKDQGSQPLPNRKE